MAVTTTNLGVITAYGDAVAAGYTGTKAEWQALMASYATVAEEANQAKDDAVSAKNTAVAKATEATTAAATANTAKDTATSKATEATTAANTATTKANEASASAQSIAQSASQIAQNTSDISELKEDFATMESDGVVPSAEQILTDKGVTDSVPYHFRKTGGDGADRLYDKIVGGSLAVNQLALNPNFDSTNNWACRKGTIVVSNNILTATVATEDTQTGLAQVNSSAKTANPSHRYYLAVDVKPPTGSTKIDMALAGGGSTVRNVTAGTWNHIAVIHSCPNNEFNYAEVLTAYIDDNLTVGQEIQYKEAKMVNLTAMLGTTIADYVYSLETATAGAGVAWLKAHFPRIFDAGYIPYNAGTLEHVSGLTAHKMVGFNQWDEEWESGSYDANTGLPVTYASRIRCKNPIRVVPGAQYYCKYANTVIIRFYDFDDNFIGASFNTTAQNSIATVPSNAVYMRIVLEGATSYSNNVCINLSDPAKNGTYEPYKGHSYPLDDSLTLRGLFKLDANNKLYADGDTYDADGTVTRRYGVVDLGTLTWKYQSTLGVFYVDNVNVKAVGSCLCPKYVSVAPSNPQPDKSITLGGNGWFTNDIAVVDSAYTDVSTFTAAMSGVMLVYELATPTTEEADPYQHLQQCDPNGTEEYVSTGIVPVGHNTQYPENLRAKVEQLPWNFANLIAPTESTFTATRNYTTGELFIVNNVLYKATSNIANGGTITPNTNCAATTLAEIISALA